MYTYSLFTPYIEFRVVCMQTKFCCCSYPHHVKRLDRPDLHRAIAQKGVPLYHPTAVTANGIAGCKWLGYGYY